MIELEYIHFAVVDSGNAHHPAAYKKTRRHHVPPNGSPSTLSPVT